MRMCVYLIATLVGSALSLSILHDSASLRYDFSYNIGICVISFSFLICVLNFFIAHALHVGCPIFCSLVAGGTQLIIN